MTRRVVLAGLRSLGVRALPRIEAIKRHRARTNSTLAAATRAVDAVREAKS